MLSKIPEQRTSWYFSALRISSYTAAKVPMGWGIESDTEEIRRKEAELSGSHSNDANDHAVSVRPPPSLAKAFSLPIAWKSRSIGRISVFRFAIPAVLRVSNYIALTVP